MYEWCRKFRNGVISVTDALCLGQAHHVVTPESTAAVEAIEMENHHVTVDEIAANLNISYGSAHHVLRFHKVSARWIPRQLTPELKELCLMPLENFCGTLEQKVMASLRES